MVSVKGRYKENNGNGKLKWGALREDLVTLANDIITKEEWTKKKKRQMNHR